MDVVSAENNWWGEIPPAHAEIVGPVDIDPYDTTGSNALIPDLLLSRGYLADDVRLEWRDRAAACGYRVLRSTMPQSGFTDISGHLTSSSYYDAGAGASPDNYYYFVEVD